MANNDIDLDDVKKLGTLKRFMIAVAVITAVAFLASLISAVSLSPKNNADSSDSYASDTSRSYDESDENDSSDSSDTSGESSGQLDSSSDGQYESANDISTSDAAFTDWETNNPELAPVLTHCSSTAISIYQDYEHYPSSALTSPSGIGVVLATDALHITYAFGDSAERPILECFGRVLGVSETYDFPDLLQVLGQDNVGKAGTDYMRSTTPLVPAEGWAIWCLATGDSYTVNNCILKAQSLTGERSILSRKI